MNILILIFGDHGKCQLVFYLSLSETANPPKEVKSKTTLVCNLINTMLNDIVGVRLLLNNSCNS